MASIPAIPAKVFLFSGHMIDAPGRATPRFPPQCEASAADAIGRLLDALGAGRAAPGGHLAVCSGACGGDLLFAEAALARGLALEMYLPSEPATFAARSVDFAGDGWHERFLHAMAAARLHVLARERGPPPPEASIDEETNRWMLEAAGRFGPGRVEFVCLWDGAEGDGRGGTRHMAREVQRHGGRMHWIDSRRL